MTARSWLYVPGDQPNMLSGAEDRGADALIVDLEDAVVPANKQEARRVVSDWLESRTSGTGGCDVWVRVNPGALLEADVDAATRPGVSGLCLAKTSGPRDVEVLDRLLARAEESHGMTIGTVRVMALLEDAAVLDARLIASHSRIQTLQLGEADLKASLGSESGPDERELLYARSHVVMASAAAGKEAPGTCQHQLP